MIETATAMAALMLLARPGFGEVGAGAIVGRAFVVLGFSGLHEVKYIINIQIP